MAWCLIPRTADVSRGMTSCCHLRPHPSTRRSSLCGQPLIAAPARFSRTINTCLPLPSKYTSSHFTHLPLAPSHPTLNLLTRLLQFIHIRLLVRPANTQPLLLTRLRNHVKVHMIDHLVGRAAVVLQNVIVHCTGSRGDFFEDGEDFEEGVVGDVG